MSSTNPKLELSIETITKPGFLQAFDRLCADPMPVGDRYALARSREDVHSHFKTYKEQHLQLVKRLGGPEAEVLAKRVERLKQQTPVNAELVKALEDKLAAISSVKGYDGYAVDEDDDKVMEEFSREYAALKAVTFKIYATRRVALGEFSKLTALDIQLLLDVIQEPAQEEAKPADAPAK